MPSMTIYQIQQDAKGFIWMGTENGLCRYDGKEITPFNTPLLKGNEIIHVKTDPIGRIWVSNLEGQLFYLEEDQFHQIDSSIFPSSIRIFDFFFIDQQLFIITVFNKEQYLYVIDYNQQMVPQTSQKTDLIVAANAILKMREELILIGGNDNRTSSSVYQINKEFSELSLLKASLQSKYPGTFIKTDFFNELLVFSTSDEVNLNNLKGQEILLHQNKGAINNHYLIDNRLWVSTNNGAYLFQLQPTLNSPISKKQYFPDLSVSCLFKDRESNYWFGTKGQGIFIVPSLSFLYFNQNNSALKSDKIFSILVDNQQRVLLGQADNQISVLKDQQLHKTIDFDAKGRVLSLSQDRKGRIICGGDRNLNIIDQNLDPVFYNLQGGIKQCISDHQTNLWIAHSRGVTFVPHDKRTDQLYPEINHSIRYSHAPSSKAILPYRTYALMEDFQYNIWIGTTQGLFTYRDSLQAFLEDGAQQYYSINAIVQSRDSSIWVATQTNGLLEIRNHKIYHRWSTADGLQSNICRELFEDDWNHLWVGTSKGISRIDLQSRKVTTIDQRDGLPSNEISAIYVKGKEAWIGSPKGLSHFSIDDLSTNDIPPLVHIRRVSIWEKDTTLHSNYDLAYNQNNLKIEFVGLNHRARGQQKYRYRMLGLDTTWIATPNTALRFPELNPGTYAFEVVAINEDGLASTEAAKVQFHIATPWWATWWFRLLALTSLVFITGGLFYLRFQRIRQADQREAAFRQEVNNLKMQALQTQMNPHFIFNALNAIQQFLTTNDQEQAMIYLARFARLIRLIFEQSKRKLIRLEEELELLELYLKLEKLRFKNKIEVFLEVDPQLEAISEEVSIPPLLIQPVVENSFKHGLLHRKEGGKLWLSFVLQNDRLVCTVKDNGIGRKKAAELSSWRPKEYRSSGLVTTQKRLNIVNGVEATAATENQFFQITDLHSDEGHAIGTEVSIHIQVANGEYEYLKTKHS
ncbi:MAG: two-component regulator propeller domain-containing protein [Bacteroidota bacterium]